MTWPTDDLTTVNMDSDGDSPLLARAELIAAVSKIKAILAENPALLEGATFSGPVSLCTRSNWSTRGAIDNVIGQIAWKNYQDGHTIFDASAGTAPDGSARDNSNSGQPWVASYPTLMGWNGSQTYGVRVDSARVADNGFYGSAWSNVTTSRALGSTYTNTSGRFLIAIIIVYNPSPTGSTQYVGQVGGNDVAYDYVANNNSYVTKSIMLLVPPGSTYRITSVTGLMMASWKEFL